MASKSAKNSLCIFCYGEVTSDDDDGCKKTRRIGGGVGSQAKFLLLLSKYIKFQQFVEGRLRVPLTELRLCQDCSELGDSFCDLFLQLEALQLQVNWQLRTLSERIISSEESPSKLNQFRKQFATPTRNKKKEDWQLDKLETDISQLRKDLLEHCELSLNQGDQPTPKVSLKRSHDNEATRVKGWDHAPEKTRTVEASDCGSDYEGPPADDNYDDDGHVSDIAMDVEYGGFSSPKIIKVETDVDTPSQHQASSSSATTPTRKSRRVLLKCPKCAKTFGDQAKFTPILTSIVKWKYRKKWVIEHFLTKHLGISKELQNNKKQCSICKIPFHAQIHKSEIEHHIKIEHDVEGMDPSKYSRCTICEAPFKNARSLTKHMRVVHKTERTFNCSKCGKTFKKTKELRKHWRSAHKGLPIEGLGLLGDHECHLCKERFEASNLLADHLKWHERKEQTYSCSECNKIFTRAETLRRHMQTKHVPDEMMPFCCDTCGKLFGRKDRLVQHARTHFDQQDTFDCNLCGASFKQGSKLESHVQKAHGTAVEVEFAD
ncbi:Zinc finger protein-likeA [Orchesella cincta]|uniref:Zinc finger protein-likeA n=1 Tax=Orchesella cincta TaxID=48709 RepID=A0A1D2MA50_ORCCI|nr:Zinc finger protein-likeA [Orchesella cincta]